MQEITCILWKTVYKHWGTLMKEMERSLKIWLRVRKKTFQCVIVIPAKAAVALYADWKKCIGEGTAADTPEFQACTF